MSTELKTNELPPVSFNLSDAAIAVMRDEFMPLKIADIDDLEGYDRVHKARMFVKGKRVDVEKMRKQLKEDSLRYGRAVDAEAKRITALLEPIESHLEAQEKAVDDELARRKAEKQRLIDEALEARRAAEEAARRKVFEEEEAKRRAAWEAEEAKQKAIREALEAEQRAVEAERKRLADLEAARLRAIEDERIRVEAAEKARLEAEARAARAKAAEEARARKAAQEALEAEQARLRAEAMRPDREKVLGVANAVDALELPDLPAAYADRVARVLVQAAADIRRIAADMR